MLRIRVLSFHPVLEAVRVLEEVGSSMCEGPQGINDFLSFAWRPEPLTGECCELSHKYTGKAQKLIAGRELKLRVSLWKLVLRRQAGKVWILAQMHSHIALWQSGVAHASQENICPNHSLLKQVTHHFRAVWVAFGCAWPPPGSFQVLNYLTGHLEEIQEIVIRRSLRLLLSSCWVLCLQGFHDRQHLACQCPCCVLPHLLSQGWQAMEVHQGGTAPKVP